jgi:hypothetical protein
MEASVEDMGVEASAGLVEVFLESFDPFRHSH